MSINGALSTMPAQEADAELTQNATVLEFKRPTRTVPIDRITVPDSDVVSSGYDLRLLGSFRLTVDGSPVTTGSSAQRLLVSLACFGRQASRDRVSQTLWPDSSRHSARVNLRATLYRLRRQCPALVHSTKIDLRLPAELHIDADNLRAAALTLLSAHPDEDAALPLVPFTELTLDLLPDWDEDWLLDHQFSYRRLRLDALTRLTDLLIRNENYGAAVQTALSVIQVDPLRETAHETLIRAYVGQGNRHEAISHYTTYRKILRDELGLEPAAELDELLWHRTKRHARGHSAGRCRTGSTECGPVSRSGHAAATAVTDGDGSPLFAANRVRPRQPERW